MDKIVTATEMARLEKLAYARGCSEMAFMEAAGMAVAKATEKYINEHGLPQTVTLLIGKGNNGGDAFVAGQCLLERGYRVVSRLLYALEECSPLSQVMAARFQEAGGKIAHDPSLEGVVLDGLVGTGFHGRAEGALAQIIEHANQSGLPVLSIDIPSGLNGNTGEVATIAIKATQTLYLGLPKWGFFLEKGWDHVGKLVACDFGLPASIIDQAASEGELLSKEEIRTLLPPIKRTRHKYDAGYVLTLGGKMSGAAFLASYGALKAGAGIVRLFYPEKRSGEYIDAPWELIREPWNKTTFLKETSRAKCLLLGSGWTEEDLLEQEWETLLHHTPLPCVIDGGALLLKTLPEYSVLTPHRGEMEKLLQEKVTFPRCQHFADEKKLTLVLKGAPTVIFHPHTSPRIMPYGDPGMATAGSGDVLAGIIAGLIAQGLPPLEGATLGVYLHGTAGEIASTEKSPYCLIASDILTYLPQAFLSCSI